MNVLTHIIFIGLGALLLGPLGAFLGWVLAIVVNSRTEKIEEEWRDPQS